MSYIDYTYTYNAQKKQIADLKRENQWLKPFGEKIFYYTISKAFNYNNNISIDEISFHNGIKYVENCWKLSALHCDNYTEEEKDSITKGLELTFKIFEKALKDDLKSRGLLIEQ